MRRSAALVPLPLAFALALAAAPGPSDPREIEAGREVYERCAACHSLEHDRTGPRHCGLFGRRAGSVPGFPYSEAMKRSGIVWSPQILDAFLSDPLGRVPGTIMGYAGIADPRERAQLIAFLVAANRSDRCRGGGAPANE